MSEEALKGGRGVFFKGIGGETKPGGFNSVAVKVSVTLEEEITGWVKSAEIMINPSDLKGTVDLSKVDFSTEGSVFGMPTLASPGD